jgi:hypothetical protein
MLRRVFNLGLRFDVQEPDGDGSLKTVRRFPAYRFSNRVLWAIWRKSACAGAPPGLLQR